MKALSATGYLPFPLRNACAQFLVHTLKLNWQLGADWYESNLIDYDPASNWVNWLVLAGLLPDSAEDKPLSINFLTKKYDPQGKFVRHWIHALDKVPDIKIFHPELMDLEEQKKYGPKVILSPQFKLIPVGVLDPVSCNNTICAATSANKIKGNK